MNRFLAVSLLLVAPLLAIGGCKGKPRPAKTVAAMYVNLMAAEKYDEAAKLWDYDTDARKQNEDWDNIQEGQRKLIIDKLAAEKATSLKLWSGYFSGVKVVQVQETEDSAVAALEGGRVGKLELTKIGEEWKISGVD